MITITTVPYLEKAFNHYFDSDILYDGLVVGECSWGVFKYSGVARLNSIYSEVPLTQSDIRTGIFGELKKAFPIYSYNRDTKTS